MDKKDLFQIGNVAKMFNLSVGSLRHYEKSGLLKPEYVDEETGYRYYSTRQFEVLTTIRFLRVLGMSLNQIQDFLNNRDINKMLMMLKEQNEIVVRKQEELKFIQSKIEQQIDLIQDAINSEIDVVSVKQIPKRRVAWIKNTLTLQKYFDLEPSIRRLEENEPEGLVWLGKIGVGIGKDKLLNNKFEEYDMVFLILNEDDKYKGKTEIWQQGNYACLRFKGSHKDAPEHYKKLIEFINNHNMKVAGFSREITLIDDGITNDKERFVTEIQIPIEY